MITYKEQFDKLTAAYINGEVQPLVSCACFVGNLLGGSDWSGVRNFDFSIDRSQKWAIQFIKQRSEGLYTPREIVDLERNFLEVIANNLFGGMAYKLRGLENDPNYENALFLAFESTLEMLKQIHISKGEIIDEVPVFAKRTIVNQVA